jgi:hypothetical protein
MYSTTSIAAVLRCDQMPSTESDTPQQVRIWFGDHLVVEYAAEPERAHQYAEAMRRRFAGLRVTVDTASVAEVAPLPAEDLWTLTP